MKTIQKPGKEKPVKKTMAKKKAVEKEVKVEIDKGKGHVELNPTAPSITPTLPVKKETSSVALTNLDDLMRFSKAMSKSGMFPGIQDEFQALSVIEYGREIGLKPIVSLQTMTVIKGRLCIFTQALAALAKEDGITIEVVEKNTKGCTVRLFRLGSQSSYTSSFTEEDAKRAGLLSKDNYMNYPEDMYYCRAVSRGVKVFAPGLALGLHTAEELDEGLPGLIDKDRKEPKPEKEQPTVVIKKEKAEKVEEAPEEEEEEEAPAPEPPEEEEKEPDNSAGYALEFEDTIKEIKMRLEKAGIKEQLFKKYLHEELQPVKPDRCFVDINEFGHLSFHKGKMDDLKVILAHFKWFCEEYVTSKTFEESDKEKTEDPI